MPRIEDYRSVLEHRLAAAGWTVAEQPEPDPWWIASVWMLRSLWHPRDFTLFLVFLVDPQAPSGAPPASVVWAVAAAPFIPRERGVQWPALLPLGRRWERELDDFITSLFVDSRRQRRTEARRLEALGPCGIINGMRSDELRSAALALSREERAKLAQDLIRSLDDSRDEDVDAAWVQEVTRRAREVADGTVQPVDWEIARERIARRLRERRGETEAPSRG